MIGETQAYRRYPTPRSGTMNAASYDSGRGSAASNSLYRAV